jgi:16S rRNA processing protein RimM
MAAGAGETMVCVAQVGAAHGVRGAFRVRCFTEMPENVTAYGPLCDENGNELFELRIIGTAKGGVIAKVDGITDRDAADALRGAKLYVPRSRLPAPDEDEFYHEDLVGLAARDESGQPLGNVTAVLNFGAGDILEITAKDGDTRLVPFTRAAVPVLDFAGGFVQVVPPTELPTGEIPA